MSAAHRPPTGGTLHNPADRPPLSSEAGCPTPESEAVPHEPVPFWLALHTNPHKEYAVREILTGRGFDPYLPEEPNAIQRRDRPPKRPFFPLYLFVRFPGSRRLEDLQWTPGLRRIVTFGGKPAMIPEEVIDQIRARLAIMESAREGPFKSGDRVRITKGPFRGLDAVFDRRLSRADRVRVFLDFASRLEVPVELGIDGLRAQG